MVREEKKDVVYQAIAVSVAISVVTARVSLIVIVPVSLESTMI